MGIKKIVVSEQELNHDRAGQIVRLLKNIVPNNRAMPRRIPGTDKKLIFCVSENQITDLGQFRSDNIKEQFKTRNPNFKASYYEIWDRIDKKQFELERIYFHIYFVDKHEVSEYLLLHTDPKDPDVSHGDYKRSPHLHFKKSCDDIIPHAHIALNINDYNDALSSLAAINKCFLNHIKMIGNQILHI